jgi:hypothetical protein
MNSRWGIYLKERFPLIPNLIAAWGMVYSAALLALPHGTAIPKVPFALALIGGVIFLAQIRFMDELKDIEKDKIAHPTRPLPRGLFTPAEFAKFIQLFQILMFVTAALAAVILNLTAGLFFAFGTVYLYLMYKEFFCGSWLSERPILYALTHQIIIVPMLGFGFTVFAPESYQSRAFVWYSVLLVTAFFTFEVGRKLDPNAHPLLRTYLYTYGKVKTALLLAALLIVFSISAYFLGLSALIGFSAISLVSLIFIWKAPSKFKWIEGIIMLLFLASLWAIPVKELL